MLTRSRNCDYCQPKKAMSSSTTTEWYRRFFTKARERNSAAKARVGIARSGPVGSPGPRHQEIEHDREDLKDLSLEFWRQSSVAVSARVTRAVLRRGLALEPDAFLDVA